LARIGHSRDGKDDHLQIVFGLLCNIEGCPVAVEVFDGDTGDPTTLTPQIQKVRERFGLQRVIWVGDRGMITEARINEDMRAVEGLQWITALRAPAIRKLVEEGALQPSLFDERDMAEIQHPEYPGERLIACRNPFMADRRARKRQELLEATERELEKIVLATTRAKRPLRGKDAIGIRVGKVIGKYKMGKHFDLEITEESFCFTRNEKKIVEEAALDGIYVIRTSVPTEVLDAESSVGTYKRLSEVERAFRSYKTVDLKVRPIYHHLADRVRAHVFLCMLAYYVEWHMRQKLAPILFDDDEHEMAEILRKSVVAPAERSPKALEKARTKQTDEGLPVQSFQSLLKDLATIAKQHISPKLKGAIPFSKITIPTSLQEKALRLLGIRL
jgi:transposase